MHRFSMALAALLVVNLSWAGLPASAQGRTNEEVIADVQAYVRGHRDDVSFACVTVGSRTGGVFHNADERFPLASTQKIVVLAEYARQVSFGLINPQQPIPLSLLDAYYLPGTDGGAHPAFLDTVTPTNETIQLQDVVRGMIRYSSNAATDYLTARLGRANFPALYNLLGLRATDLPTNFLGLFLTLENHETGTADVDALTESVVAFESARLSDRYINLPEWRAAERAARRTTLRTFRSRAGVEVQEAYFDRFGGMGSAREFAVLMEQILNGTAINAQASAIMRQFLAWPLDFEVNRIAFSALGTKGGSLPGILTSAWYGQLNGGAPVALAIFYRRMPDATWRAWRRDFDQQYIEFQAIRDACASLRVTLPP